LDDDGILDRHVPIRPQRFLDFRVQVLANLTEKVTPGASIPGQGTPQELLQPMLIDAHDGRSPWRPAQGMRETGFCYKNLLHASLCRRVAGTAHYAHATTAI
jgi:hypothetical protein